MGNRSELKIKYENIDCLFLCGVSVFLSMQILNAYEDQSQTLSSIHSLIHSFVLFEDPAPLALFVSFCLCSFAFFSPRHASLLI